ncbi:MAG TPA: Uma2 family endonuclease, partial [Planctomycetaceae bacterium]|nr:Uma2 family endonuclease [Planctomycetaceae bacterium]
MATTLEPPAAVSGRLRPALESGDRYTRAEFEARSLARPDLKKVELIEGVVYVASAVRLTSHSLPDGLIHGWMAFYVGQTPGLLFLPNTTLRLDDTNSPQPDAVLAFERTPQGAPRYDADDFFVGPPELIVEIAASSASYDLHDKKQVYERNGVREYAVVIIEQQRVAWFELVDGRYVERLVEGGIHRSRQFPGLWLDTAALFANSLPRLFATLQQG